MKKSILLCTSSGLAASLIILLLSWLSVFERLELKTLDWRFQLRGEKTPDGRIAIVLVEGKYRRSLSRKNYAVLVKQYQGASAIGFDLILDKSKEDEDKYLAIASMIANVYYSFGKRREGAPPDYERKERVDALDRFKWEINAECEGKLERLEGDEIVAPLPEFSRRAKGIGHVYSVKKPKEVLRKIPLLIEYEGEFYPFLSLQIACDVLGVREKEVCLGKHIKLITKKGKSIKIPIDEKGYMFINYVGPFETFERRYFLSRILEELPEISDVILVGAMMKAEGDSEEVVDCHKTPSGDYPGVGIHANVLNNILREDFLHRMETPKKAIAFLLLGLMIGGIIKVSWKKRGEGPVAREIPSIFFRFRSITGILLTVILSVAYLGIAFLLFKTLSIWIDVVAPLMFLLVIMFVYFVIAVCQLDIRLSPSIRKKIGEKGALIRYFLGGILIIGSFIIVVVVYERIVVVGFAIVFLLLGFRVAGLISAEKFQEQIGKVVNRMIPGSNGEEDKESQSGNAGT